MSDESELVLLRMGFEEGLFGHDDVRAWVDQKLALLDELPAALLDLSMLAHKPDHEIVTLLRALEPDVPAAIQAKVAVAVVGALYAAGRVSMRDVVSRLYCMAAFNEGLSDDERSAIYELDAALDLAAETMYGTLEEVGVQVDAFFADYPMVSRPIS